MAEDEIARAVRAFMGDGAAERGFAYARAGRVIEWGANTDCTRLTGTVQGQGAAPYVQDIALEWSVGGRI